MIKSGKKEEALRLLRETSIPIYRIAEKLNINNATLYRWNRESKIRKVRLRRNGIAGHGILKTIMEELQGKYRVADIADITKVSLRYISLARAGYSIQLSHAQRLAELAGYEITLERKSDEG